MLVERISLRVREIISAFGLLDPDDLAGCLGFVVVRAPLRTVHGMVLRCGVLAVNSSLPLLHQRGAVLHECAHRILHPGESRFFLERDTLYLPGRRELEADVFALLYLMEWDKPGFEECETDLARFAAAYGLPRHAADAVLRSFQTYSWGRLCG